MRLITLSVLILATCNFPNNSLKASPVEQIQVKTTEGETRNENYDGDNAVTYAPESHIRIEDVQTALENLVEQEGPIKQKDEKYQANKDLAAQESMAESARRMTNISLWGTILSAAGLLTLLCTLKLTRQANNISSDTAQRELRAYLNIEDFLTRTITTNFGAMAKAGSVHVKEYCEVTNIGKTHARNVRLVIEHVVSAPYNSTHQENVKRLLEKIEESTPNMMASSLQPNQNPFKHGNLEGTDFSQIIEIEGPATQVDIEHHGLGLWSALRVTYEDVFHRVGDRPREITLFNYYEIKDFSGSGISTCPTHKRLHEYESAT